jgi:hypothetical protein
MQQQCSGNNFNDRLNSLEELLLNKENYSEEQCKALKHKISHLKSEFKHRWLMAKRTDKIFQDKNKNWLSALIELPSTTRGGCPKKDFEQLSDRSKRRKTEHLRKNFPAEELLYATQMSQRAAGNADVSAVMKNISESPTRAARYRKAFEASQTVRIKKLTPSQALAIFIEANLSRRQYEIIQGANKEIYPCYSILQKAKEECYPKVIHVTESCAEVNLQDLLDHTSLRLCQFLDEVFHRLSEEEKCNLELLLKWGCDGSQQTQFKQKFNEDMDTSDSNIFQSSFVPLRLRSNINEK